MVIYDISRGSRDVADWFQFRKTMRALGVQVISTNQQLGDITNPNDFLIELINVGLGQMCIRDRIDNPSAHRCTRRFCIPVPKLPQSAGS